MDDRIIEFIRGMRGAGVRVSMAEGMDAFRAVEVLGISDKANFRESLRTTLIKESKDFEIFDRLFPLYFSGGEAPMESATEELSDADLDMLQQGAFAVQRSHATIARLANKWRRPHERTA